MWVKGPLTIKTETSDFICWDILQNLICLEPAATVAHELMLDLSIIYFVIHLFQPQLDGSVARSGIPATAANMTFFSRTNTRATCEFLWVIYRFTIHLCNLFFIWASEGVSKVASHHRVWGSLTKKELVRINSDRGHSPPHEKFFFLLEQLCSRLCS